MEHDGPKVYTQNLNPTWAKRVSRGDVTRRIRDSTGRNLVPPTESDHGRVCVRSQNDATG